MQNYLKIRDTFEDSFVVLDRLMRENFHHQDTVHSHCKSIKSELNTHKIEVLASRNLIEQSEKDVCETLFQVQTVFQKTLADFEKIHTKELNKLWNSSQEYLSLYRLSERICKKLMNGLGQQHIELRTQVKDTIDEGHQMFKELGQQLLEQEENKQQTMKRIKKIEKNRMILEYQNQQLKQDALETESCLKMEKIENKRLHKQIAKLKSDNYVFLAERNTLRERFHPSPPTSSLDNFTASSSLSSAPSSSSSLRTLSSCFSSQNQNTFRGYNYHNHHQGNHQKNHHTNHIVTHQTAHHNHPNAQHHHMTDDHVPFDQRTTRLTGRKRGRKLLDLCI